MSVSLNEIIITRQLSRRSHENSIGISGEITLLHCLARSLGKPTAHLLTSFVEDALTLTAAGSAGVSLLETDDSGTEIFRWVAMAGAYKSFVGGTTPRRFSPCGACLDRKRPQLYSYPARHFDYFSKVQPSIVEGLVVPIRTSGIALGTIWVVSHDLSRRFNSEDVRVLTSIAEFLGCVLATQETSARYQALSACSPVGVFETDKRGNITYANARFYGICGYEPECIDGQSWSFLLRASDRTKVFAEWRRKTKKAADYCAELAFERPSGEIRWISLRSSALRYDGLVKGSVSSVEDITERRSRDERLRESEQFKAHILSGSPDCIKVLDEKGRLIFMNSKGMKRMEIDDLQPLLGRKWISFWSGAGRSQARKALAAARAGSIGKFQGETPTLKGTPKWWNVTVTLLRNQRRQPERYLAISRDITREKVAERALLKANQQTARYAAELETRVAERTVQLEKANTELRALAGQLIHAQEEERRKLAHQLHDEIGQELTGLKLLLDQAKIRNGVGREATGVIAGLISQISNLAQDLRPAVLERLGLLAALRWQFGRFQKRFGLKVIFDCKQLAEEHLTIVQKVEAFRIIQEALTNAFKHSGVKTVRVSLKQAKDRFEISIRDRGEGFDLRRASRKTSLGLIGMRERAARLGGEINVVSSPHRGTQVRVLIPMT